MNEDSTNSSSSSKSANTATSTSSKRMFTTASTVSPSSSVRDKRARRDNEDDLLNDLCDDTENEDEHMLYPFPAHGMQKLFRARSLPLGVDPRGPTLQEGEKERPSFARDHCMSCLCEKDLCHNKRFGLFCGLRVAELVEQKGADNVTPETLSKLLKFTYNQVLRVETVQHIGILDTYNDYDPPRCMIDKCMKNIMRHFLYTKYTARMKSRLQDGSKGKYGTGAHGFYSALHHQVSAENEMDAEDSD